MYLTIKIIHMSFALISLTSFLLRALLMFTDSPLLRHRAVLITPHIIDTVFLLSGFTLAFMVNLGMFSHSWLALKIVLLMCYLLFVGIALNRGTTKRVRTVAFGLAIVTFVYIVGIALHKSPASWFSA